MSFLCSFAANQLRFSGSKSTAWFWLHRERCCPGGEFLRHRNTPARRPSYSSEAQPQATGTNLILSWPAADSTEYMLQTNSGLSSGGWANAGDAALVNGKVVVTNSALSGDRFFRLCIPDLLGTGESDGNSPLCKCYKLF